MECTFVATYTLLDLICNYTQYDELLHCMCPLPTSNMEKLLKRHTPFGFAACVITGGYGTQFSHTCKFYWVSFVTDDQIEFQCSYTSVIICQWIEINFHSFLC